TNYEGGHVTVTSHRLIWTLTSRGNDTCLVLSLSYIVYVEEETPGAFHFTRSAKLVLHLSSPLPDKAAGPVMMSLNNFIKLSFKDGLEGSFISALNSALERRKWQQTVIPAHPATSKNVQVIKPRAGIVGIERNMEERRKATDDTISAAFKDLTRLMDMAKDMVVLAKNISTKIRDRQGTITEDETVQFKSYLLSLGIDDPVTRDAYSSETKYMDDLAHELVEILETPIREQGGMMSLVDAYCRVNRARGLELLSPEDLLAACRRLATLNLRLRLRQFSSGVLVLQLASHDDQAVIEATEQAIKDRGSLTADELSQELGISVLLAKERLLTTESYGKACRDQSIEGLRFYPNLFIEREDDV
ncbi:hypothetical protein AAG570_001130, partial [Ranatra chinensis]